MVHDQCVFLSLFRQDDFFFGESSIMESGILARSNDLKL